MHILVLAYDKSPLVSVITSWKVMLIRQFVDSYMQHWATQCYELTNVWHVRWSCVIIISRRSGSTSRVVYTHILFCCVLFWFLSNILLPVRFTSLGLVEPYMRFSQCQWYNPDGCGMTKHVNIPRIATYKDKIEHDLSNILRHIDHWSGFIDTISNGAIYIN